MKIKLYFIPKDKEGEKIEKFLQDNNLLFKKIITNDLNTLQKGAHFPIQRKISLLEIRYSHQAQIIIGFIERDLNQLLEHIKKYNLKINNKYG
jgi:hypothetical protein